MVVFEDRVDKKCRVSILASAGDKLFNQKALTKKRKVKILNHYIYFSFLSVFPMIHCELGTSLCS